MKRKKHTYLVVIFLIASIGFILVGSFQDSFKAEFVWRSILLNVVFFTMVSLSGTLFYSMHKLARAKWIKDIQTVLLSMGEVFVFLLLLYLILFLGLGNNFDWVETGSDKAWYLNHTFFIARNVFILGVYALIIYLISKRRNEKNKVWLAIFLMFFGVTILFYGYDWIVSLDQHWYSTLFGWYLFSGLLVSGVSVTIVLLVVFDKRFGLKIESIVYQNLAKYLFAFSMVWAYLWYVQYLLVWYVNKPGEAEFYLTRLEPYSGIFYTSFILSFVVPFVLLLSNFARKNKYIILIAAIAGIIGQWLDKAFYILPIVEDGLSSVIFIAVGVCLFLSIVFFVGFNYRLNKKIKEIEE